MTTFPELIAYSCYARQLTPFVENFGKSSILPVFFERLLASPQGELRRISRFIGYPRPSTIEIKRRAGKMPPQSVCASSHSMNSSLTIQSQQRSDVALFLRPSTMIRKSFTERNRPVLANATRQRLVERLDEDLSVLGEWLGTSLNCNNFRTLTSAKTLEWR